MVVRDRAAAAGQAVQTAPGYSALAGAAVGVALWALSRYVFHGEVPEEIQLFTYLAVPAILAGVSSHLTRRYTVPAASPPPPPLPPAAPPERPGG